MSTSPKFIMEILAAARRTHRVLSRGDELSETSRACLDGWQLNMCDLGSRFDPTNESHVVEMSLMLARPLPVGCGAAAVVAADHAEFANVPAVERLLAEAAGIRARSFAENRALLAQAVTWTWLD